MTRDLHPVAWWGWAIGVALAASLTTNPLLLGLLFCSVWLVVANRRGSSPWARAFRLYVILGAVVIVSRLVFYVLVGFKFGVHLVLRLPSIPLPDWAAGIQLGGDVFLEGLLAAACLGLRLAVLIIAIGAANALANPKRLLRSLPRALHELGTAVVVSVSVAPQLAESVQRVMRARHLRGEAGRGLRVVPRVALPVLQDTLDRSLLLASAMEARGYGSHTDRHRAAWLPAVTLGGLVAVSLGMYGVLDPTRSPALDGDPGDVGRRLDVCRRHLALRTRRAGHDVPARPVAAGRDPHRPLRDRLRRRHALGTRHRPAQHGPPDPAPHGAAAARDRAGGDRAGGASGRDHPATRPSVPRPAVNITPQNHSLRSRFRGDPE